MVWSTRARDPAPSGSGSTPPGPCRTRRRGASPRPRAASSTRAARGAGPGPRGRAGLSARRGRPPLAWGRGAGRVRVPEAAAVLGSEVYLDAVLGYRPVENTLAYGQAFEKAGFHVMEAPTDHWVETATGLGATGVELMLAAVSGRPPPGDRRAPPRRARC